MEGDLRSDVDAELGHRRTKALLTERVERRFALPSIDVVVVIAFPLGQMGEAAVRPSFEPSDLRSHLVVLRGRNASENYVSNDCHDNPPCL